MNQAFALAERYAVKKDFSRIGLGLFLAMVFSGAAQVGIMLLSSRSLVSQNLSIWLALTLPLHIFGTLGFLLGTCKIPYERAQKQNPIALWQLFLVFCAGMAANIAANLPLTMLRTVAGALSASPVFSDPTEQILIDSSPVMIILVVGIIAPFMEEVIFRGLLIGKLRSHGEPVCVLASAMFFSLMHGNLWQLPSTFALGAIWAYITLKTGTIMYSVALHMANNLIVCLLILIPNTGGPVPTALISLFSTGIITLVVIGIVVFIFSPAHLRLTCHYTPARDTARYLPRFRWAMPQKPAAQTSDSASGQLVPADETGSSPDLPAVSAYPGARRLPLLFVSPGVWLFIVPQLLSVAVLLLLPFLTS